MMEISRSLQSHLYEVNILHRINLLNLRHTTVYYKILLARVKEGKINALHVTRF